MKRIIISGQKVNCDIDVPAGQIMLVSLAGTAGITELDITDNAEILGLEANRCSLFGSIDGGVNFEAMSASLMKRLSESRTDLILRIDCSQLTAGLSYHISAIEVNKPNAITAIDTKDDPDYFWYDASQRAFDQETLVKAVEDNMIELSKAAQDNAGWPIKYYRADTLKNVNILNAYELRAVNDYKVVQCFFPKKPMIGQLDFNQFGLEFEELTNIHILASEFRRVFKDQRARPNKLDVIYIAFLDQYFEISDVADDQKTPIGTIIYFDITLRFISDRKIVAKQEDILDLSDMVDSMDQNADLALKGQNPDIPDSPIATYQELTWSRQKFSLAERTVLTNETENMYGIAYVFGWKRIMVQPGLITMSDLDGNNEEYVPIAATEEIQMYFAKMARFNKPLDDFNIQMYYTTPTIPRTLQPLELMEHQTVI